MTRWQDVALLTLLLPCGCAPDYGVTENPVCDGVLQPGEETVDAPFDRDGDGAFDGTNPGCAETYDAAVLDCNDVDAEVNPRATEVLCNDVDDDCDPDTVDEGDDGDGDGYSACDDCDDTSFERSPGNEEVPCNDLDDDCDSSTPDASDMDGDGVDECSDCDDGDGDAYPGQDEACDDGIDNDCDGEIDEDCGGGGWSGGWNLDVSPSYSCAWSAVNINFSTVYITDMSPALSMYALGGYQPGTMTGSLAGTSFAVSSTLYGTCNETYTLTGYFTSDTTFTADFRASFSGTYCFDCVDQAWMGITGTRF